MCQRNCKPWQFYGHLFLHDRIFHAPELQTMAILWPLFGVYSNVALKLQTNNGSSVATAIFMNKRINLMGYDTIEINLVLALYYLGPYCVHCTLA